MLVKKVFIIFLSCCFFSTTVSINTFAYSQQNTNDVTSPKEQLKQFMQKYLSSEANESFEQILACKKGKIDLTEKEFENIVQNIEKVLSETKQETGIPPCFIELLSFTVSYISLLGKSKASLPSEIVATLFIRYLFCLFAAEEKPIEVNTPCGILLGTALLSNDAATGLILLILHYLSCFLELF